MDSLVTTLRDLIAATTTEYTVGSTAYWTDAQLYERLDRNRTYITGGAVDWIPEPVVAGGGSVQFKRAAVNVPGMIEPAAATGGTAADWSVMTSGGVVPSGTVTVSSDGHVEFTADQTGGPAFEFYGFCYDMNAAAADVLDAWASHVKTAYDFKTDDQQFDRSQAYEMLTGRARELRRSSAPRVAQLNVVDDNPAIRRTGAMTANQRRTLGL